MRQAKFGIAELLYLEVKAGKTVIEGMVASYSTTGIVAPRGITEDSFKMTLYMFKKQAFTGFAASYHVNHLQ